MAHVIEARSARFLVAFLGVIALAVAGFVLMELRALVLPLVLALFLSVASRPMVRILRARRIPYALIVMVILLGYAVVFGAISYGLVVGAGEVLAAAPDIQAGIAARKSYRPVRRQRGIRRIAEILPCRLVSG